MVRAHAQRFAVVMAARAHASALACNCEGSPRAWLWEQLPARARAPFGTSVVAHRTQPPPAAL
eukprot:8977174-Alexandrium_andersonii.AAC.1